MRKAEQLPSVAHAQPCAFQAASHLSRRRLCSFALLFGTLSRSPLTSEQPPQATGQPHVVHEPRALRSLHEKAESFADALACLADRAALRVAAGNPAY
jgi:hypothetical protein